MELAADKLRRSSKGDSPPSSYGKHRVQGSGSEWPDELNIFPSGENHHLGLCQLLLDMWKLKPSPSALSLCSSPGGLALGHLPLWLPAQESQHGTGEGAFFLSKVPSLSCLESPPVSGGNQCHSG